MIKPSNTNRLIGVLNALRHQRFWHVVFSGIRELCVPLCLTPYGIRGFGMRIRATIAAIPILCLTPYGIRGFGISSGFDASSDHLCA